VPSDRDANQPDEADPRQRFPQPEPDRRRGERDEGDPRQLGPLERRGMVWPVLVVAVVVVTVARVVVVVVVRIVRLMWVAHGGSTSRRGARAADRVKLECGHQTYFR